MSYADLRDMIAHRIADSEDGVTRSNEVWGRHVSRRRADGAITDPGLAERLRLADEIIALCSDALGASGEGAR